MSAVIPVTEVWAQLVWAATWQLAALAIVVALGERLLRLREARVRHALWWFVLLAPLLLAPGRLALARRDAVMRLAVLPAPVLSPAATMDPFETGETRVPPARATAPPLPQSVAGRSVPLTLALAAGWGLGALVCLIRLAIGHGRVRRLLREAGPVEEEEILHCLTALCSEAGVRRPVALRSGRALGGPLLYGVTRPVIVLPEEWLGDLPASDLEALLAHEVAHVRRRDFAANLAQRLLEAVLFFHPATWIAGRRIAMAREELCDAWALARGANPHGYASALTAAAERSQTRFALALVGVAESRFTLLRRVEAIMRNDARRRHSRWAVVAMAAVAVTVAAVCAAGRISSRPALTASAPARAVDTREAEKAYYAVVAKEAKITALGQQVKLPDVTLQTGGTVEGRVLEAETGKPVKGAPVFCRPDPDPNPDLSGTTETAATTGADGAFTISAPPGKAWLYVSPPTGYGQSQRVERVTTRGKLAINVVDNERKPSRIALEVASGAKLRDVTLYVMPMLTLKGRAMKSEGKPMTAGWAAATVVSESRESRGGGFSMGMVQADGAFSGQVLPGLPLLVVAYDKDTELGGAAYVTPTKSKPAQVRITVHPMIPITGRLLTADGKPAAGADVVVDYTLAFGTRADDEGRFALVRGIPGIPVRAGGVWPSYRDQPPGPKVARQYGRSELKVIPAGAKSIDVGDIVLRPEEARK